MITPEDIADIESLPDYIVLRQVQEALWNVGEVHGAAVMIGAGFSRFADRAAATTPVPPLWGDFRDEMLPALYPCGGGPTDTLVLAEEYRAALGEPALENLIRKRVPDGEWSPGSLHRRLLQLPWADVLTTNWDTLLERAAAADPDTSYDVVRVATDIARARQPRIVKLHGSMPSHTPFIFSEEDFRTYPQRFAAFVNLAQQVLLENELCLLGFSGDDPNFLQWAGWVRDRLGKQARPIRLVGVLNLPQSRRRFLEGRNITPIDLAPLVRDHPKEDRHRRAVEMFLESLWQARPRTNAEWQRTAEKEYGVKELERPEAQLTQLTKVWAEDRKRHPGWLVTPYHERELARYGTTDCVRVLAGNLSKVPASVGAPALFEAVWRWETMFWGLPDFLEQAVDAAVGADEDKLLPEEQRVLLRVAIVRAARRRRDWSKFEARIIQLEALAGPQSNSEAAFERCLRARDEIDYQYIEDHAAAIGGSDPIWLLRRASLLADILDTQNAARTVREAYEEIRRRRAQDRRGLWLLSREAWASWLMQCARFELDEVRGQNDRPDWPLAYKAAKTDPWDELHAIDAAIDKADSDKRKAAREREALFDAGRYRLFSSVRFGSGAVITPYAELACLADAVGIPLRLGSFNLIEERFARSIEVSFDDDAAGAWTSLRSILSHDRGLVDTRFSRVAVARLPPAEIEDMSSKLRSAIAFGQKKVATAKDLATDWSSRVRSLVEILSRLTLRFESDAALEAFRFGAAILADPALKHWWVLEGLGNLMRRSLLAVTPNRRGEAALDILLLPLPCEKKIAGIERDFPELSDSLSNANWRTRDNSHAWTSRISFLLNVVAENKHAQSREHAVLRLLKLFEAGALTDAEEKAFGMALWRHTGEDGLPSDTNLLPHVFLQLPCPDSALARRKFEGAVVQKVAAGALAPDLLSSILSASYTLRGGYRPFALKEGDALGILDHALKWKPRQPEAHSLFSRTDVENERIADAMGGALASTVIPSLTAAAIGPDRYHAVFDRIGDRTLPPLLKALPALVKLDPSHLEDAVKAIRTSLLSQDHAVIVSALTAIFWFARFAQAGGKPVPPSLVAETVSLCLMRREPGLVSALRTARSLVTAGAFGSDDQQRLLQAIELIRTETSYEHWRDAERHSDVGLIRGAAVKLAAALRTSGVTSDVVDKWLAEACADPMPEVRHALSEDDDQD